MVKHDFVELPAWRLPALVLMHFIIQFIQSYAISNGSAQRQQTKRHGCISDGKSLSIHRANRNSKGIVININEFFQNRVHLSSLVQFQLFVDLGQVVAKHFESGDDQSVLKSLGDKNNIFRKYVLESVWIQLEIFEIGRCRKILQHPIHSFETWIIGSNSQFLQLLTSNRNIQKVNLVTS